MIWITSDFHFGHDREFIWRPRGFENVEEMNEKIVENYNKLVTEDDDVYVLGDLMLGDSDVGMDCLRRLPGKLHIVRGNHDTDRRMALYTSLPQVVEIADAITLKYKGYHFFLCHYPTFTGNLEKESLKQVTCNLYGHTHQTTNFYNDIPFMYHVGVDSHCCDPVLLETVICEMQYKYRECQQYL